jgi:hypothetical protein
VPLHQQRAAGGDEASGEGRGRAGVAQLAVTVRPEDPFHEAECKFSVQFWLIEVQSSASLRVLPAKLSSHVCITYFLDLN